MQGVAFKPRAYEKAAETINNLEDDLGDIYKKAGLRALKDIPGVGISIAEKIEELIKTGRLKYYEDLKKKTPVNLSELSRVEGLGPKSIKKLYSELRVKNLNDLEKAAKAGKIRNLEDFGIKSEENILKGIEFLSKSGGRMLLGRALPIAERLKSLLLKVNGVKAVEVAGSLRRRKETIGDLDILVVAKDTAPVMEVFVKFPEVVRIYGKGGTKSSVHLKDGIDADLRVVPEPSYGAALAYFTGSKDHNVALRKIAVKKGWKLNEYGLFNKIQNPKSKIQKWAKIAGKTEEEVYKKLGLEFVPPEMRENWGEVSLAEAHKLPNSIGYGDLMGDLQIQTDWTDGGNGIEEYVEPARGLGLKYIAITDHSKHLAMVNGLNDTRVLKQIKEIDRINSKLEKSGINFRILTGIECDILKDGRMDLSDSVLARLDIVGASIHSYFNLPGEAQTERLKRAMANKNVDIIFHPTGRVIGRREACDLDMEEIILFAKKTKTVLEINGEPERLDLKDEYIRKCVEAGVKMSVDSDAHNINQIGFLDYGISQARRGWAEKSDIINAWPVEKMLKMLK